MNLDERIEAAWKEHMSRRYYPTERETDEAQDEFTDGYRAAMRSLFIEVKSEDLQEDGIYHARWADQPMREVYYDGEQLCYWEVGGVGPNGETEHIERNISPEDCEVREFVFPSPAEIFGNQTH